MTGLFLLIHSNYVSKRTTADHWQALQSRWVFSILSWALQGWLLVDGWTCDFSLRHWCLTMRFLLSLRCGSKRTISDLLKHCSACECDGAHNMPLNHGVQTTTVHNNPEPFILFHCSYFLIFMVSARPGQNYVWEYLSWLVLAFIGVTLDSRVPENVDKHRTVANSMFVGLTV